jgi:hypothetical protein
MDFPLWRSGSRFAGAVLIVLSTRPGRKRVAAGALTDTGFPARSRIRRWSYQLEKVRPVLPQQPLRQWTPTKGGQELGCASFVCVTFTAHPFVRDKVPYELRRLCPLFVDRFEGGRQTIGAWSEPAMSGLRAGGHRG